MSANAQPRFTVEEYLEFDRKSEIRNEYYNGQIYAMAGGTHNHAIINANISGELRARLKGRACRTTSSDLRVQIPVKGSYVYPDVVVVCGEPQYGDKVTDVLLNPTLVIEVLSPSTESLDRGLKSSYYRSHDSLREYAIVSQTEARVEIYTRQPSGWLLAESAGLDTACHFKSVDCTVPLAEIYDKVNFEQSA